MYYLFLLLYSCFVLSEEPCTKVAALHWAPTYSKASATEAEANDIKKNNRLNLEKLIRDAASEKNHSKLVVTPELGVVGYPKHESKSETRDYKSLAEIKNYAELIPDPREKIYSDIHPSTAYFSALASELKIYLHIGLLEKNGSNKPYNTVVVFDPDGRLVAKHRKSNLVINGDDNEFNYLSEGNSQATTYEANGIGKVGLAICADIYSDNLITKLESDKPDLLAVSSYWSMPEDKDEGPTNGWGPYDFAKEASKKTKASVLFSNYPKDAPGAGIIMKQGSSVWDSKGEAPIVYGCVPKPQRNSRESSGKTH